MQVPSLEKKIYMYISEHKISTRGSRWYIEELWNEMIGLCKKLSIMYNIPTCIP